MSLAQCPTPGSSDAGHLLDGMPDSAAGGGEDRIGALPDDILRIVLSFLPSRESVCTCVLARRWRNLWKSVPTVLVYEEEEASFVTSLLLLRDRVPLREFVCISSPGETPQDVEMWLRYAASCHVRVLQVEIICTRDFKWRRIFSKLKTLYLSEWCLAADFSGLVYFLQHSPILEKLTVRLSFFRYWQQPIGRKDESYKPRKQFLISKNLKEVEIKHPRNDEKIHQIVMILVSLGVPPEHIKCSDYGPSMC